MLLAGLLYVGSGGRDDVTPASRYKTNTLQFATRESKSRNLEAIPTCDM
jgi:hypothetical protein